MMAEEHNENPAPMLYIVRGAPSMGKSTFCKTMLPHAFHVENDMFHYKSGHYCYSRDKMPQAVKFCLDAVKLAMANGCDVAVSNTFTKKSFIDSYAKLAEEHGYGLKVFRMMHDFKTNVHEVPESVLKSMHENFQDYPGEAYVYPNFRAAEDPVQSKYILTNVRVGDKIIVSRHADHKLVHEFALDENGMHGDSLEMEECIATVTDVHQGTYDYMNVHYTEDDTQHKGMSMGGFFKKAGEPC